MTGGPVFYPPPSKNSGSNFAQRSRAFCNSARWCFEASGTTESSPSNLVVRRNIRSRRFAEKSSKMARSIAIEIIDLCSIRLPFNCGCQARNNVELSELYIPISLRGPLIFLFLPAGPVSRVVEACLGRLHVGRARGVIGGQVATFSAVADDVNSAIPSDCPPGVAARPPLNARSGRFASGVGERGIAPTEEREAGRVFPIIGERPGAMQIAPRRAAKFARRRAVEPGRRQPAASSARPHFRVEPVDLVHCDSPLCVGL